MAGYVSGVVAALRLPPCHVLVMEDAAGVGVAYAAGQQLHLTHQGTHRRSCGGLKYDPGDCIV